MLRLFRFPMPPKTDKQDKQDIIDEANKLWPLSKYDKEGRHVHEKLKEKKLKCKRSEYEKWTHLDRYLVEKHFANMQRLFLRQEKERLAEEDEQNAEEEARTARLSRLTAKGTASAGYSARMRPMNDKR